MKQPSTMVVNTAVIHAESREQKETNKTNCESPEGAKKGSYGKKGRNDPLGLSEDVEVLQNEELTRSASCDPTVSHLTSPSAKLKRAKSSASLGKGISSCDGSLLQKGLSIVITTAIIHAEKGRLTKAQGSETNPERPRKDVETPQETAHLIHKTSKSRPMLTQALVKTYKKEGIVQRGKTPKTVLDKVSPAGVEVYVEVP